MERATPVERSGRLPWGTGHGSLWSSPSRSVRFMSTLCTGCRNLGRGGEARGSDKEGLVQCVQGNAMELEKERLSECV